MSSSELIFYILEVNVSSEYQIRSERRKLLLERGLELYPYSYDVEHSVSYIRDNFDEISQSEKICSTAGRITSFRKHGKSNFADLSDQSGKIQLYFKADVIGDEKFKLAQKIDIGDFIGVKGSVMKTRTGEITIKVQQWFFLAKALMNLPEKFHGLKDPEVKYRQRYLDFLANPQSREKLVIRSKITRTIRNYLDDRDFLEVETPVLQPIYGGAFAQPFITHYNSLDADFYLRVSNELYLKRLLIGGFERVYEFAKDFRNEGMDRDHNPEFTQLEIYWAYVDYNKIMELTEEIFREISEKIFSGPVIEIYGKKIDFSKSWRRLPFFEALKASTGYDLIDKTVEELQNICRENGVEFEKDLNRGKLLDLIFSQLVQPDLFEPTFIIDHPIEISPLAKVHRENNKLVERFEPIICQMEIGNAFSELNDPVEQRKRLEFQNKLREEGGKEYEPMDEDFLKAMSYGMPPAGGLGLGIDRMIMLFTSSENIKEVLAFPQLKPKKENL